MALLRLLDEEPNEGGSFAPEDVARMVAAYEAALALLALKDRADPVTEVIAKKIIAIAGDGETDPSRICALAIRGLGIPVRD
jgi:hypothetical protein